LLEVFVSSVPEVFDVMQRGQSARVVAFTNMNAESSRSHSIFQIHINQKNLNDGSTRTGKLSLVDLAGSEKIGKTGATGQTLEEAKKINKSLSALGMVINSLTDGKSTHIPYRDSKLTRILQESLGGNSRTTLIINCSPSSFNEAETLSTLRFGMRAKTITNKAKVNADLSPAELKSMLKKLKSELSTSVTYCSYLEMELGIWRTGGSVAEADWVALGSSSSLTTAAPNKNLLDVAAEVARPSTPLSAWTSDEREEFLKRENELSDQLEESEAKLKKRGDLIESMKEENAFMKIREEEISKEKKDLYHAFNDIKLQLESLTFEHKDGQIMVDSLKEDNREMATEIESLKKQISALETRTDSSPQSSELKEKKKQDRMAEMMAEFDTASVESDSEKQLKETLAKLAYLEEQDHQTPPTLTADIEQQYRDLWNCKSQLQKQGQLVSELVNQIKLGREECAVLGKKKDESDAKLSSMHTEYENLLNGIIKEKNGDDSTNEIEDLTMQLEAQYLDRNTTQEKDMEDLRMALLKKDEDIMRLSSHMEELSSHNSELKTTLEHIKKSSNFSTTDLQKKEDEIDTMRKSMAQQLADFASMKKKLMRDLQNRCEKVVELEISLDENREIVRNSLGSKSQQQKMSFLERNLEQLTSVQKQLVEQNSSLKKDFAVAERKLAARNERISKLEELLQDAQAKLELQNQKFDSQLSVMREKLQEAKSDTTSSGSWLYSSRIAKPLRGGVASGGENADESSQPEILMNPSIDKVSSSAQAKRSSWYVSLMKK